MPRPRSTAAAAAAAAAAGRGSSEPSAAEPDAEAAAAAVGEAEESWDGAEDELEEDYEDDEGDAFEEGDGGAEFAGADDFADADDGLPTLKLDLPPPTNTRVKAAEFMKSSVELDQCPKEGPPEFAVIGRSNVGKSSLINMLTGRRSLAMVSKSPGKTQCINHFTINGGAWYLVDLPGYGYARRSKDQRRAFEAFTRAYLKGRRTLAMAFLLVDASIPPQAADLDYAQWLASAGVPFSLVFTKADKRKKGGKRARDNADAFRRALVEAKGLPLVPPSVLTSASTGAGKQELLALIASLRVMWESSQRR